MSKIEKYFKKIDEQTNFAYQAAKSSKLKGFDNSLCVEIGITKDISQRVETLVSILAPQVLDSSIAKRVIELEKKYGKLDWRIAFEIGYEVATEKFCKFKDKKEAMEIGIRIGFAYLTLGVVSAPIEGFINLDIKKRFDNQEYIAINYAGPIRAAGGTAGAVSVLLCDFIRNKMGYANYDPNIQELKRYFIEIKDYNDRCVKLQYMPTQKEIEFLIKNIGVEISGESTEKTEVSNYKDLDRVNTNRIRGGMCLIVAECIIQKAPKIYKRINEWGSDFSMQKWLFLKDFLNLQKKIKSESNNSLNINTLEKFNKILPNYNILKDVIAGRPVFSFPMKKGGFRLRYGRNRVSGFASSSISSATYEILDNFIGVGTQLRIERPGKSTIITPCDTIEGPIVKLKNDDVVKLNKKDDAIKLKSEIKEILHLGDILLNYGDFYENNHILVPNGYCEEEWVLELLNNINN
ncbi:MAG: hypothetical protein ACOC16_01675 [Nanoarchaeota archaeon]